MKEWNEQQLLEALAGQEALAVFLHTPLCGTCKAVRRMVEVAEELAPGHIRIAEGNVNLLPGIVQTFRISSVPALLLAGKGDGKDAVVHYRLDSVQRIVEYLRSVN